MNQAQPLRVGADIGGTFTDLVFACPDGSLHKRKVPSTPADYSRAIIDGISAFCTEYRLSPAKIGEVVHATTVATNAILERKGARTALLTTEGFRDVLELRRIRIPMSYDLGWQKPPPLVERELRLGVSERLDAQGAVLVALSTADLAPLVAQLRAHEVEAIAVCFLHSYRNANHEKAVGKYLGEHLPGVYVSLSHEVLPEILEFERTSTTVVNAYVAPLIARYLTILRSRLDDLGSKAPILVMQSNGGLISATVAGSRPVTIIESGPAAGVIAAARLAIDCGYPDIITLDMGGTTTKASIIEQGEILRATEYEVGSAVSVSSRLMRGNGYTLRIPVIDISEVGAGGGSIAAIDAGGSLRVGPRSAGAVPGPACYGQGNTLPTVTDANLVLGYLNNDSLAGGSLKIQRDLAEQAVRTHIAEKSGLSLLDAAYGAHLIANSNMVRAIKSVSVERGRDPRDFVLMVFGGAGPIHAVGVARELGIKRVIIPPAPGVFSAFGLLRADVEQHAARTVLTSTRNADLTTINSVLEEMRAELVRVLTQEGYDQTAVITAPFADLRYQGQSSEITLPLAGLPLTEKELRAVEQRFELEFERTYGHRSAHKQFELVTVRLIASVSRLISDFGEWADEPGAVGEPVLRNVYFGAQHGTVRTAVIPRAALAAQARQGPVIIQEYDTSVIVPPGCNAALDMHRNIIVEVRDESAA
ncbi:hydantoinase/oxoprolinase family protein [Paralcaligenes sp. KSB-10]|uniref:hydantoinase/oxoprolinase family protein n=1 Tax=Paralcaligenes sp. KSB-10 TaxID=2901142 RepID=UPI001E47AB77|nr:hydantoinase/oxoprolinase family protein [Paralcaligenes sp. KSB-10]UHL63895.1 hydantoinase/oxoprolinase family protein [Paralcaligenes sp. KSB-10]